MTPEDHRQAAEAFLTYAEDLYRESGDHPSEAVGGQLAAAIAQAHATLAQIPNPELVEEEPVYLLWSGKRSAWWKPFDLGYTSDRSEAGRYTRTEALDRVARSADSGDPEIVTRMVHMGATS